MTRKIPIPLKSPVGGPKGPRKPRNGCSRTNQPYDQESSQPPPGSMTNWEQSSGNQKTDGPAKLQIDHWNHREIVTKKKEHQLGPSLLKPPFQKAENSQGKTSMGSMIYAGVSSWYVGCKVKPPRFATMEEIDRQPWILPNNQKNMTCFK